MFKKILVPLDGSALAAAILPQVKDLAQTHQAQVTLMTVGHLAFSPEVGEASGAIINEAAAREKEASENYLKKTAEEMKGDGIAVNWVYTEGMPAREIVAYAKSQEMRHNTALGIDLVRKYCHVCTAYNSIKEILIELSPDQFYAVFCG